MSQISDTIIAQLAVVAETTPTLLEAELDTAGMTSPIKSRVAQLAGCSVADLIEDITDALATTPIMAMLASATGCSPGDLVTALAT